MQTCLKRLGFQFSTRWDMSAKFPRGGGGGGEQTHSQPSVYMYKFCLSQRVCMYMYLVGLEPYAMASAFFHVPTLCMQAEKALVRLQGMHMLVCAFAACICDKYKSRITLLTC